jgi:nucleoside 2-deoxyribosyltransferase
MSMGDSPSGFTRESNGDACFVMMPFDGFFEEYYRDVIAPAAVAAGLEPVRSNEVYSHHENVVADIRRLVEQAVVCVADLTGKNPNVLYELGLAHGRSKPVVLLAQTKDDVPFDLLTRRVVLYDTQKTKWDSSLQAAIKKCLAATLDEARLTSSPPVDSTAVVDQDRVHQASSGSGHPGVSFSMSEGEALFRDLLAEGVSKSVISRLLEEAGLPRGWIRIRLRQLKRPGW